LSATMASNAKGNGKAVTNAVVEEVTAGKSNDNRTVDVTLARPNDTPTDVFVTPTGTTMAGFESQAGLNDGNSSNNRKAAPGNSSSFSCSLTTPVVSNISRKTAVILGDEQTTTPDGADNSDFGQYLNISSKKASGDSTKSRQLNLSRKTGLPEIASHWHLEENEDWNNDNTLQTKNSQNRTSVSLVNLFETPPQRRLGSAVSTSDLQYLRMQQEQEEQYSTLSIPALGDGTTDDKNIRKKQEFSTENTANVTFRRSSFLSESSWESDLAPNHNDDDTLGDSMSLDSPPERDLKRMHLDSNRRLSLTVDMKTGKSPSTGGYHRGQHVLRRSLSSDMLNAQSPKSRRIRAMSERTRKIKKMLALPPAKSSIDAERNDPSLERRVDGNLEEGRGGEEQSKPLQKSRPGSVSFEVKSEVPEESDRDRHITENIEQAERKKRHRYSIEPMNVRVKEGKQRERDVVQYRLSTITPADIRRRQFINSISTDSAIRVNSDISNVTGKCKTFTSTAGTGQTMSRWRIWIMKVRFWVTEFVISAITLRNKRATVGFVNKLLYWSFRKNLVLVCMLAAFFFFAWTFFFALLLYLIGHRNPKCIHVNGKDFDETTAKFMDAFALSWTTFTTVGYGLVYPGTSATLPEDFNIAKHCTGMTIVTTLEAFVGILFSAFWGAVLFAKVTRVASHAQISFSKVAIIKYGKGATGTAENEYEYIPSDDECEDMESGYKKSRLPLPILEFRIANRLNHRRGGEIIDATINIVASMAESEASQFNGNSGLVPRRRRRRGRRLPARSSQVVNTTNVANIDSKDVNDYVINDPQEAARNIVSTYLQTLHDDSNDDKSDIHQNRDNDTSDDRIKEEVPNQVFAKLVVESMEHPFFNRVWTIRHVLDESSPILKQEAKELIRLNNGHWPEDLNTAIGVRASINFTAILVSFSGTSNVDANSVYSQHAYTPMDIYIGYSFCNMLFRASDGSLGVDPRMLNVWEEQKGGGGEILDLRDAKGRGHSSRHFSVL